MKPMIEEFCAENPRIKITCQNPGCEAVNELDAKQALSKRKCVFQCKSCKEKNVIISEEFVKQHRRDLKKK